LLLVLPCLEQRFVRGLGLCGRVEPGLFRFGRRGRQRSGGRGGRARGGTGTGRVGRRRKDGDHRADEGRGGGGGEGDPDAATGRSWHCAAGGEGMCTAAHCVRRNFTAVCTILRRQG